MLLIATEYKIIDYILRYVKKIQAKGVEDQPQEIYEGRPSRSGAVR